MRVSGIYQIQSKIKPQRIYLGSSIDIYERWKNHLTSLRHQRHKNPKLQSHFNKYGEADLLFSILLGCEKEDLIKIEQYFLDSYKPWFNVHIVADRPNTGKRSKETCLKMSKAKKGKPSWNKGLKTGPQSEETKRKRSEANKGHVPWIKGKKMSVEYCKKQSESLKRYHRRLKERKHA